VDPDEGNRDGGAVGRRFGGRTTGSALELAHGYASNGVLGGGGFHANMPRYSEDSVLAAQRELATPGRVEAENGDRYASPEDDPNRIPSNPLLRWWHQLRQRRSNGGVVVGPVIGETGGRADAKPVSVEGGSYVIPADIVAAAGDGNTLNGHRVLDRLFGSSAAAAARARGGPVPIRISDGEHVLTAEQVARCGSGNHDQGCRVLDRWVKDTRAKNIKRLKGLPGPAKG
jgi:hypothetical protein